MIKNSLLIAAGLFLISLFSTTSEAGEFYLNLLGGANILSDSDLDIPLEDREIGGLGIYLTRTLMDDLEYERTQEKNVLRMKKELS